MEIDDEKSNLPRRRAVDSVVVDEPGPRGRARHNGAARSLQARRVPAVRKFYPERRADHRLPEGQRAESQPPLPRSDVSLRAGTAQGEDEGEGKTQGEAEEEVRLNFAPI